MLKAVHAEDPLKAATSGGDSPDNVLGGELIIDLSSDDDSLVWSLVPLVGERLWKGSQSGDSTKKSDIVNNITA